MVSGTMAFLNDVGEVIKAVESATKNWKMTKNTNAGNGSNLTVEEMVEYNGTIIAIDSYFLDKKSASTKQATQEYAHDYDLEIESH